MRICALMVVTCTVAACANPNYLSYDPPTIGLGQHGERQAIRLQDLQYCRKEVAHFHQGPGLGDMANGATRGAESGAGVALVYPPAMGIGGAVGFVNAVSGQAQADRDVRMLVNCLTGEGIQHGYVVIDANR